MKTQITYQSIIDTPIGKLGIQLDKDQLTGIHFMPNDVAIKNPQTTAANEIVKQLATYFANPQHAFTLPLRLKGSTFQQGVWRALMNIPTGTTKTYGTLANENNTSARAIGNACRTNPLPIIIPCHRVVARNNMGGYGGATSGNLATIKQWLLEHEKTIG